MNDQPRDRRGKEAADYINEFYELVKDDYPHLSENDISLICRNNFKMLKKEMESGSLKKVRLMYLGSFLVHKGRAIGLLNKTIKMFESGKVNGEILAYIRSIVKRYLKREYNEDLPC